MVKVIDFNTPFTLNSRERTGRKAWLDKKAIPDDVYWHDISQTWGKVDSTVREIGGEYYLNVYVDSTGLTAGEYQDMFTVIQGDQTTDYLIKFSVKDPNPPPPPPPPPPRIEYVDRPVVRYQHDPDYYSWGETLKMLFLKSGWVLKGIGIILGIIISILAAGLLILFMIFVMAKNDAKDFPGYVTSFFNRPTATPVITPTLTPAPTQAAAQAPPTATQCALLADSRLKIGDTARVSMQLPIKRKIDDTNGFDTLYTGDLVEMINGPICFSANTLYWQVISYDKHLTGWTFEIGYSQFYLVPYDSRQMTATPTKTPQPSPTLSPTQTRYPTSTSMPPGVWGPCASPLLPSRVKIGDYVHLIVDHDVPTFRNPRFTNERKVTLAAKTDNHRIADGPVCVNGVPFWEVDYNMLSNGWIPEIENGNQYVFEPYQLDQTPTPMPCDPTIPRRVKLGDLVKFVSESGGAFSSNPGIGEIGGTPRIGSIFKVVGGPICYPYKDVIFVEWRLRADNPDNGMTGWMPEYGTERQYLYEPLNYVEPSATPTLTTTSSACSPAFKSQIQVGQIVKFSSQSLQSLYLAVDPYSPTQVTKRLVKLGEIYKVIDGPKCVKIQNFGDYLYWRVQAYSPADGLIGWLSETDTSFNPNISPYDPNAKPTVTPAKSPTLVGCKNRLPSQVKLYDIVEVNVAGYSMLVDPSDSDKFVPNSQMNNQYWYQIVDGPKCSASGYVYWQLAVWGRYESVIGWMPESDYQNKYIFQPDTTYKLQNTPMKPIRVHLNQVVKITKAGNKKGYYSLSQSAGQPTTVGPGLVVGDTYRVLAGPLTTSDGYVFWQLQKTNQTDLIGWLAEVDLENDYLFAP